MIITKIKDKRGFSLTEMLIAMLILLLATAIVARGVPVAKETYEKTVDSANAQVLMSTVLAVLRDDVGMAETVTKSGSALVIDSVTLTPGSDIADDLKISESLASRQGFTVEFEEVAYPSGSNIVEVKKIKVMKSGSALAKTDVFKIKTMNG